MADATGDLETMFMLGQLAKDMLEGKQAEFNKSNPHMDEAESQAADLLQRFVQSEFAQTVEKNKKEGFDFNGMDALELRFWAPDAKCVCLQLRDYLVKEYGVFHHVALSSGLVEIAKDKLFFISLIVKKMSSADIFGKKKDLDQSVT